MNQLPGIIREVTTAGALSVVQVEVSGQPFTSVVIGTPADNPFLQVGAAVWVQFKETETAIGKRLSGELSIRNRLRGSIVQLERGQLLTRVVIAWREHRVSSVITTLSADRLALCEGEEVEALIKTNEILLRRHE